MPRTQTTARTTARTARPTQAAGTKIKKLKDARASAKPHLEPVPDSAGGTGPEAAPTLAHLRLATRTSYEHHLARATSKQGDRYSKQTIDSYLLALDALDRYLERQGFEGDFLDVDVEMINAFLADYRSTHEQGGTNTKLRKLRPFFNWAAETYGIDNPYATGRISYYAPGAPAASTLAADVIEDLLGACRPVKGSPTEFEDIRDTALILLLRSGVRRGQLASMFIEDINFRDQTVQVIAQKGARRNSPVLRVHQGEEFRAGHIVPISDPAMIALQRWLRIRAVHPQVQGRNGGPRPKPGVSANSGPLWYGTRGRGAMTGNGILRMIKRRAEEAGYDPNTVNAHAFRHTRADELMRAQVPDGDIMAVMGWSDRGMLDRYGANLANERAIANLRARRLD